MTDVLQVIRTWKKYQLMIAFIGVGLLGAFSCVERQFIPQLLIGWTLGTAFNLCYLLLVQLVVYLRQATDPQDAAKKVARFATFRYFYAMIFLALIAIINAHWIIGATCGLLSYRLTLIWYVYRLTSSK